MLGGSWVGWHLTLLPSLNGSFVELNGYNESDKKKLSSVTTTASSIDIGDQVYPSILRGTQNVLSGLVLLSAPLSLVPFCWYIMDNTVVPGLR